MKIVLFLLLLLILILFFSYTFGKDLNIDFLFLFWGIIVSIITIVFNPIMDLTSQLKRGISRQFSTGSFRKSGKFSFKRQNSLDPRRTNLRFSFGRQSSLDPIRRSPISDEGLAVPENLDSTMQLLFLASKGDVDGLKDLLDEGVDVNSIDLDGRTALHIASCEGHEQVVRLLLTRKANIDARDRWGSTVSISILEVFIFVVVSKFLVLILHDANGSWMASYMILPLFLYISMKKARDKFF